MDPQTQGVNGTDPGKDLLEAMQDVPESDVWPKNNRCYTVERAAKILKVHTRTIIAWCNAKPPVFAGLFRNGDGKRSAWMIPVTEVQRVKEQLESKAKLLAARKAEKAQRVQRAALPLLDVQPAIPESEAMVALRSQVATLETTMAERIEALTKQVSMLVTTFTS